LAGAATQTFVPGGKHPGVATAHIGKIVCGHLHWAGQAWAFDGNWPLVSVKQLDTTDQWSVLRQTSKHWSHSLILVGGVSKILQHLSHARNK